MSRAKRRQALLLTLLSLALVLATVRCGPAPTAIPQPAPAAAPTSVPRGGTFTASAAIDGTTLQPLLMTDTYSVSYTSLLYDSLLTYDPTTLAIIGRMAQDYGLSDDGLTLTINLRRDMTWSDSVPITAADFTFTWDKMMDEKVKFAYRQQYASAFESLTAPDDFTLVYKVRENNCRVLDTASFRPIPKHVFENLDINNNEFNTKPTVFSGPFKLHEWAKDDHITFVANDLYYRGRPNLDTYVIRIVPNTNVQLSLFQTGEIDVVSPQPADWETAKAAPRTQALEWQSPGSTWQYMGFNLDHPFFKDVRVRQALNYALDRKSIIDQVMLGAARPQYSFLAQSNWAYSDDVERYDFNPAKARELLKEAGWTPGADGILVKDGQRFKIRISYAASVKYREQIATIAQQQFREVGVAVELHPEEGGALLARVNSQGRDLDAWLMGWATGADPDGTVIWATGSSQNYYHYANPAVDSLFAEGLTVRGCKQDDRKNIYTELQKIITKDAPCIFLFSVVSRAVVSDRIAVNPISPLGFGYAIEKWYSKTGK